jgi:pyrroline-5-carboxylate reductase
MPNTPALVRRGITGLFAQPEVDDDGRRAAERVLAAVGETLWCRDERQLDAITAVSGSGPAYLFHYLESMIAAAEDLGFAADEARRLAYATASGAIALAERSSESPAVLRAQVTSKGGTTAAALAILEARDVAGAYREAVRAADARAAQLGDQFGGDAA